MSLFVPLLEFNQFQNVNYWLTASPKRVPIPDDRERVTETKQRRDGEGHRGTAKFKSFWARSRHPLTPACAVALCTALSPNTFARIGAVVNLKVEDYYPSGKRLICRCMAQFG